MQVVNRRQFIRDSILAVTTASISEPLLNQIIDEVIEQGKDVRTINLNELVMETLRSRANEIMQNLSSNNVLYARLMERAKND